MNRKALVSGLLCALLGHAGVALAAPPPPTPHATPPPRPAPPEGTVLSVQGGDVIVDLGRDRGATDDEVLELWRPYRLRHPVTGKVLVDRFRIGAVRLSQVRPTLSLAHAEGKLLHPVQVGDIVAAHAPPSAPKPLPKAEGGGQPPPVETTTPQDPDARSLSALFDALAGSSPNLRALAYEDYVVKHPTSRYVRVLREEAAALRAAERRGPGPVREPSVRFSAPELAYAARPMDLAIEVKPSVAGAVAYVRAIGQTRYAPLPMHRAGPGYFAVTVPAANVVAPGIEYFIETTATDGHPAPAEGTQAEPLSLPVVLEPKAAPPPGVHAEATLLTDFAAYDTRRLDDYAWQTELTLSARFGDTSFRALRTVFGVYRGEGGSLHDLDTLHLDPRPVGLTYGGVEAEVAPWHAFSMIARGIVGLQESGVTGGAQLFVRIGNDLGTNLLLGGEVLGGVGLRGIAELHLASIRRVPIVLRSEVTNQPAGTSSSGVPTTQSSGGGDVGARVIAQVGYRFTDALTVALRASYEGRTINHAGPGGGAAVTYQW